MDANSQPAKSRSIAWPLWLSLLFLLVALWLGWLLWQKGLALVREREDQATRVAALKSERDHLQHLLSLSPCEAKAALAPRSQGAAGSGSGAAPVAEVASSQAEVEKACVFIVTLTGPNKLVTGSGFFVAPGYVATNKHVVEKSIGKIMVTSQGLGAPAFGKLVAISPDPTRDYALLKVDVPENADIATLNFTPDIKRTQKVGAWGFPDLVGKNDPQYAKLMRGEDFSAVPELSYSEGVVSAVLNRDPPVIVHTAPISPGNSGGPLVNEKGEVVGINTMISLDDDSYRQASLALAASDLKKFLASHGLNVRQ